MVYTIRVYLYANRTKNGGRRLPDVKHECYQKLSVKSVLKASLSLMQLAYMSHVIIICWPIICDKLL